MWPEGGRLGLAVSGGPDSLALLALGHAAIPDRIEVATVDHGLRPESAAEAEFVARCCSELGLSHRTLCVEVEAGNLQDRAREARYRALSEWMNGRGIDALATAHHADDQAETLLMRLNRGSGLAGLSGVRARGTVSGTDFPLLRPLLGWRRSELAALVEACGWQAVQDPSNMDERFDRVRMRKALASAEWLDVAAAARSASNLADAADALAWATGREWDENVTADKNEIHYRPDAPRAIRLAVLERAIAQLGGAVRGGALAALHDALERGEGGTLGGTHAINRKGVWIIRREPPRSR